MLAFINIFNQKKSLIVFVTYKVAFTKCIIKVVDI